MSLKSERRNWYAANVSPKPCDDVRAPEYAAWVAEANSYMRGKPVPVDGYTVAAVSPESVAPVVIAEVKHVELASVTPIKATAKRAKRAPIKAEPIKSAPASKRKAAAVDPVKPAAKAKPVAKAAAPKPLRVNTKPLVFPKTPVPNASVSITGRKGAWLVLARGAVSGTVHVQSWDTGEVGTVPVRECTVTGNGTATASYRAATLLEVA